MIVNNRQLVVLKPERIQEGISFGIKRHKAKDKSFRNKDIHRFKNKTRTKIAKKLGLGEQFIAHIEGVWGEEIYSEFSGQPIDTTIYAVRDDGEDFRGVEVKMNLFGGEDLMLRITKTEYKQRKKPLVYVLTHILLDEILTKDFSKESINGYIIGAITAEDFDQKKTTWNGGRNLPDNWVVKESQMDCINCQKIQDSLLTPTQ